MGTWVEKHNDFGADVRPNQSVKGHANKEVVQGNRINRTHTFAPME